MKITFLGTNGWYDTKAGNTSCIFLETRKEYIILDAGNGLYKIDKYIKTNKKPIFLFLSHFHLDHIIGLHILNKFNFSQGIKVYGPLGLKKYLNIMLNGPYSLSMKKLKTKIKLYELGKNKIGSKVKFEFKKLSHTSLCYGYRFYLENKIISYCTDTGLCDNLYFLADKSDLFITECSLLPGQQSELWPHLNPEKAAYVAKKAGVKKLMLTHFDAGNYKTLEDREMAEIVVKEIFADAFTARDNLSMVI